MIGLASFFTDFSTKMVLGVLPLFVVKDVGCRQSNTYLEQWKVHSMSRVNACCIRLSIVNQKSPQILISNILEEIISVYLRKSYITFMLLFDECGTCYRLFYIKMHLLYSCHKRSRQQTCNRTERRWVKIIDSGMLTTDSTSSCPLIVNVYSTRRYLFISLSFQYATFLQFFSLIESVLVLMPFKACLNCLCLSGFVVQRKGTSISCSSCVIKFLGFAVSDISNKALYPSKLQFAFS